jgi:histidinol dehydrogenase
MARRSRAGPILTVLRSADSGFAAAFEKLVRRRDDQAEDVSRTVRRIIERVREGDDDELRACIKKFDRACVKRLEVQRDEIEEAGETINPADRAALGKAAMRVRDFHRKRIPSSWEVREEGGAVFGHRVRPLHRVGIYVPGGKAIYPSSVIMNAVPASVVEVPEIVMATPPESDGSIRPEVLMAARVAGVHRVFKMGGAHAIAALAYGTESVPRVDKIVGPGNVYVATAKRFVFGDVDIDTEAGPSEVMIIADRSATPAWIAADLISQAEHDEMAQAILITTAKGLVARVQDQIAKQLKTLERAKVARKSLSSRGAIVVAKDLAECAELADRYGGQRRGHLPRPLLSRGGGRLPRGPQSRAAHGRIRPLLLTTRSGGLLETNQRHPLRGAQAARARSGRDAAGRAGGPCGAQAFRGPAPAEDPAGAPGAGSRARDRGRAEAMSEPNRIGVVQRKTRESDVRVEINLDGGGDYRVATGIPFFDHMLESFAKHGLFDLQLEAKGDLEVDAHHTVEDVGITLGQAVREALGDAAGIRRYGSQVLPMAEAKVEVSLDLSNRPYLVYDVEFANDRIGGFDANLAEDFFYAFSQNAGLDLHVDLRYGRSPHHVVEAIFKGVARALRTAVERDLRAKGLPTVKGTL